MQLNDAVELIRCSYILKNEMQVWTDLGCGSGTFTEALANLLVSGSLIYAADKNKQALKMIPDSYKNVKIEKLYLDFMKDAFPENLNGILLANSLHYVRNKNSFIKRNENNLKPNGVFLIVEYDTKIPNPWVPFPINFNSLKIFFEKAGYSSVAKINELPSVYRRSNIYSALIHR